MKPLKRTGEAFGGIVAVLERDVDDFIAGAHQILGSQRQAAHADIVAKGKPAEHAEHPLEMKRVPKNTLTLFYDASPPYAWNY